MIQGTTSVLLLACLAVGCGGVPEEESRVTSEGLALDVVTSGGIPRKYKLYIPSSYAGQKMPLVFMLHGFGGDVSFAEQSGMVDKGEQEGFFVASLQGVECDPSVGDTKCHDNGGDGNFPRGWSTGITPGTGIVVDDVGFVLDALAKIKTQVNVNANRVYAAGLSQGGMMTHRLAAELPDVLAAVGVVAGTIGLSYQCDPICADPACACSYGSSCQSYTIPPASGQISVAIIHGMDDDHIQPDGAVTSCNPGLDPVTLKQDVDFWVATNGCSHPPHLGTSPDDTVHRTRFAGCDQHTEVISFRVDGLGHAWPNPSGSFSANEALWNVFKRHHH
jgi:polyhydroxybutyrate depolymerase